MKTPPAAALALLPLALLTGARRLSSSDEPIQGFAVATDRVLQHVVAPAECPSAELRAQLLLLARWYVSGMASTNRVYD